MKAKKECRIRTKQELIKEIKRLQKRIATLERAKTDFAIEINHKLRTPITVIKEGVSLILDEIPGKINEKQRRILNMGMSNIDRFVHVIEELLLEISK